jgi:ribose 5-phosphate isomerase A
VREQGLRIQGVPTSMASDRLARQQGISLLELDETVSCDLTIDGADEIDPRFDMIKGGGGALLREKLVAQRSDRLVIVVDPSKCVARLGEAFPLPVEVVPFAWRVVASALRELGAKPALRMATDEPYRTDNGNYVLDARFGGIEQTAELHRRINEITGVVDNGLFIQMADLLVIGTAQGPEIRRRPA